MIPLSLYDKKDGVCHLFYLFGESNPPQRLLHELPKEDAEKFAAIVREKVPTVSLRGY